MRGILLYVPPVLSVVRPSLGVSALKSSLARRGLDVEVSYGSLRFADSIGLELNQWVAELANVNWLLGEWIFSKALFGLDTPHSKYHEEIIGAGCPAEFRNTLLSSQDIAAQFVELEARKIVESRFGIVGFSTSFQQNCASLAIAKTVKAISPSTIILFGGANCEGTLGQALAKQFSQIDLVLSGEGDQALPDLVERLLSDNANTGCANPSSLSRGAQRRWMVAPPVADLDELPVPDFSDYFRELSAQPYRDRVRPALMFESSRGCWWGAKRHCKFCGLNGQGMAFRSKSSERVMSEIRELSTRWNTKDLEAADNILDHKHIDGVFSSLNGEGYRFFYEVKSNLRLDRLEGLAKAGVSWVQPGIESLDDEILNLMDKGVSAAMNVRFLRSCLELGMVPVWNLLTGFPGETAKQYAAMAALVPAIEHLMPPSGCFPLRLDRFSPYFEQADALGFVDVRPVPAYSYIYPLPDEAVRQFAYYFYAKHPLLPQDMRHIEPLQRAVQRWRERFYGGQRPVLSLLDLGGSVIVRDTRSVSLNESRLLSDHEVKVLAAFRDPAVVEPRITLTIPGIADDDRDEIVRDLLDRWRFLVRLGRYAVSVVGEFGWRVLDDSEQLRFPGGMVLSAIDHGSREEMSEDFPPPKCEAVMPQHE